MIYEQIICSGLRSIRTLLETCYACVTQNILKFHYPDYETVDFYANSYFGEYNVTSMIDSAILWIFYIFFLYALGIFAFSNFP